VARFAIVELPDQSSHNIVQVGKELLDKELAARYQAFNSGKPVKGCKGAKDMRIRLMGLRLNNLRDELAGARRGALDVVCSTSLSSTLY
jgi:hypothetical protein